MKSEYLSQLSEILTKEFEIKEGDIQESALLFDDLGLDSIDAVDLIARLREITGKKVPPEQFKTVRTVGDVVEILEKL
jgi:acyl carrier protein